MNDCDCHEFGKILERNGHTSSCNRLSRKDKTNKAKEEQRTKAKLQALKQPKKKQDPIAKVSGKMAKLLSVYTAKKKVWIKGKRCAVEPSRDAVDVHHKRGRVGYADQWARDKNIPLLLDERFWLPVSRAAHIEITANPEWALKEGYSESRTEKKKYKPLTQEEKEETENLF